jgi:hypothetical protein
VVQAGLSKKEDSISKITITKRTGDVAQVLECLPSQHKALNSNPSTTHTHIHTKTVVSIQILYASTYIKFINREKLKHLREKRELSGIVAIFHILIR